MGTRPRAPYIRQLSAVLEKLVRFFCKVAVASDKSTKMKFLLLVAALAHAAHSGNVGFRASHLLSPAGVTYVDGSYHSGLAAGPLAYSAQPVYQSAVASVAAPEVAVAAAPVAYAAPAAKYAAVPTVQHVQGVADVPVTRIDAQPTVIQKTVDIARPAVKTQRYEVRRPAIQKQFYDIEERVVVRPAGSAVVELDEPLSRTQKGPSVIRPTGEGVAVSSSAVAVPAAPAVAALPAVSAVSPSPAELPSVEINLARSALAAPAPAVGIARSSFAVPAAPSVGISRSSFTVPAAPSVGFARSSTAIAPAPSVEVRSSIPSVSPAPVASVGLARSSFASAPAPVQSVSYSAGVPSVEVRASVPSVSPAPVASVGLARSSFAAAPAPVHSVSYSAQAPVQSVSYSAAAPVQAVSYSAPAPVHSVSYSAAAPVQSVPYSAPFGAHSVGISAVPVKTVSVSAPIHTVSGVSSVSSGVSGISSISAGPSEVSISTPAPQYEHEIVQSTPVPQYDQQIVQSTPAPQLSDDSVSIDSADFGLARSSGLSRSYTGPHTFVASSPAPTQETVFRSELSPRRFTGHATASSRGSLAVNYPNPVDLIPQSRFRAAAPVYEENFQSEVNHENQQKLIQLLTARGGVSEVGFGRSGPASFPVEAGQVRARVLSATPAPAYAAPTGERVNTRRVVISRPVETLQEVEVAEPVTKYERVRVDQPAVVKTASQEVVRVPTSVPVYGKTLAPIAEAAAPVAAYSADWH